MNDRSFDVMLSVPTPYADARAFFQHALEDLRGCDVHEVTGTYHVRLRLVVRQAPDMEPRDVRGVVTDILKTRAPRVVVVGVRAA